MNARGQFTYRCSKGLIGDGEGTMTRAFALFATGAADCEGHLPRRSHTSPNGETVEDCISSVVSGTGLTRALLPGRRKR